ncbi:hypothetical protein Tco_0781274 [Tanacetum coccineum]
MTDKSTLLQALQAIQQQLQQLSQLLSQQLQHQSQLLQQHSQQQTKQKARILDAIKDLNFRVRKKNQLLHKKQIIGFPTHQSCASPLLNSFDTLNLIRVVPTYHQDEDEDAHAIQDDNPAITKLIYVEYSRDDIAKTETPMVIEEDEKLMVFTSTKVHELPKEKKSIDPKEITQGRVLFKYLGQVEGLSLRRLVWSGCDESRDVKEAQGYICYGGGWTFEAASTSEVEFMDEVYHCAYEQKGLIRLLKV